MPYAPLLKAKPSQAEGKRPGPAPTPRATIGNQAMLQLRALAPQPRPASLEIGALGDALEQEADRAADQLMRNEAPSLAGQGGPALRRAGAAAAGAAAAVMAPAPVHRALNQTGEALDLSTRAYFEPRLGADLGNVRVHRAGLAGAAARSVGARAFTVGTDIVFEDGAYAPSSGPGRALLAHELAHVIQQSGKAPILRRQLADPDIDKAMAVINKVVDAGRTLAAKLLPGIVDPPVAAADPAAPAAGAADPATQTAIEDKVLAGDYADKGQYTGGTDASFHFTLPELQTIFEKCRTSLPVPAKPPAPKPAAPVTNIGDSSGKAISGQPEWINAFQEKLATTPAASWTRDTRLAQKLVEAALRAAAAASADPAARATPSNVGELYNRAGASTVNERATILGGVKGGQAWCDTATIRAIALGLMKGGLRFKTGVPPVKPEKPDPASTLTALTEEIRRQTTFFHQHWYNDVTKPRPSAAAAPKAAAGPAESPAPKRIVGGQEAWTTPLQPGDDITVINGGNVGPLSGHVATVISESFEPGMDPAKPAANPANADPGAPAAGAPAAAPEPAGPKAGAVISTLRYVSGNARQGAVRAEEVKREMPPATYSWSKMTGAPNVYTATKSAAAAGTRAWDKSGLEGPVLAATNELFHQAAESGYQGELDWTALAKGAYEQTDLAKLPGYAKAYELAKQALPKFQAEAGPLRKMNQMITNRKSELPVSRTDDPKFQAGRDAPVLLDHSWVVSVVRSSLLDANRIAWGATKFDPQSGEVWDQAQLDKLSLEPLDGTIDSLYPGALDSADKR